MTNISLSNVHQFAFNAPWNSIVLSQNGKWSVTGACQICFLWSVTTTGGEQQCWVGGTGNGVLTLSFLGILLFAHMGNNTSMWALLHHLASAECWSRSRSDTQLTTGLSIWTTYSQEYEQPVSSNLPKTQVHTDKKKVHLQMQSLTAIICVTALLYTKPAAVSELWPGCSCWIRMREDQKLPAEYWHKAPLLLASSISES